MMLGTTEILELLRERPGRYIQKCMNEFCMKEANGVAVSVNKWGRDFLIKPTGEQMGDLMRTSHLANCNSKYILV